MITHSALRKDGIIYIGKRHHNIFWMAGLQKLFPFKFFHNSEDGFLTQDGRFLNRQEAAAYVIEIKQELKGLHKFNGHKLYSEDLW